MEEPGAPKANIYGSAAVGLIEPLSPVGVADESPGANSSVPCGRFSQHREMDKMMTRKKLMNIINPHSPADALNAGPYEVKTSPQFLATLGLS